MYSQRHTEVSSDIYTSLKMFFCVMWWISFFSVRLCLIPRFYKIQNGKTGKWQWSTSIRLSFWMKILLQALPPFLLYCEGLDLLRPCHRFSTMMDCICSYIAIPPPLFWTVFPHTLPFLPHYDRLYLTCYYCFPTATDCISSYITIPSTLRCTESPHKYMFLLKLLLSSIWSWNEKKSEWHTEQHDVFVTILFQVHL